ncbi:hypothetical protein L6164_016417 [Bauhinia variegata]|uniref:Uncharacterized protein n=1 Tax=Bauhinia variegata TaxID=167791 RepID=A0ACB9NNU9_BAUVA|nr:hypothetical protein L6164_016417 [Bauhinia variegata]
MMGIVLSMLLVQVFATGMQLLSRVILVEGTFIFALLAYRHIVAAFCVAPFAFCLERGKVSKPGWSVWLCLFLNSLVGITMAMGFFYYGLRDTSATYSMNFLNLIPIFTFLFSIICRMEKLGLQTWAGKAKIMGAILCVGGALTISLYKGKAFYIGHHSDQAHISAKASNTNMLRGTLFLIASCLSYTAWYIVQAKLLNAFPFKYCATMLTCIMATMQAAVVGLCIDRSTAAWKLSWDLKLVTILYSGALATAATFCLISWVIAEKGPTYPPMFNPLALVFVAISEGILLGAPIRVGTLLGMVLIICGLYSFLWGKRTETEALPQANAAAGEVSMSVDPSAAALQGTAIVMPSPSPNNVGLLFEKIDTNTKRP